MWIRYFADTTDGAHGQLARAWVQTLLKIAPTVVVSMSHGVLTPKWSVWGRLFTAPRPGPFVNVVCCQPTRWAWEQNVATNIDGGRVTETTNHRIELYTAGVRNVLLHGYAPREHDHTVAAAKYEAIVVLDEACAQLWEMAGVTRPHVLHPGDMTRLREVLLPAPTSSHAGDARPRHEGDTTI